MKKALPILILFISLSLFSCQSETSSGLSHTLRAGKTISFPVDGNTSLFSLCLNYHKGKLYYSNRDKNNILIFDVKNQKYLNNISFKYEGQNGVGELLGFNFLDNDNLLISPSNNPFLYESNHEGKIIQKIDFGKEMERGQTASNSPLTSRMRSMILETHKSFFIPQQMYAMGDFVGLKNKARYFSPLIRYDKKTKKSEFLPMDFPNEYFDEGYFLNQSSTVHNHKDKIVHSLRGDGYISVYDIPTQTTKRYLANSQFIPEIKPLEQFKGGGDLRDYSILVGSYESINYDPYKKVYYRVAKLESEDYKATLDNSQHYYLYPQKIAIVVLDEQFNIIADVKLDGNLYNLHNLFITEEGLYLSTSNPNHPQYQEDRISFQLFQLKKE